jgi:hypothetical protein
MKKLFLIIPIILIGIITHAQFPTTGQKIGDARTLVPVPGALKSKIIVESFADTGAANSNPIATYPGAVINTITPDALWKRNVTATKWIRFVMIGNDTLYVLPPLSILDSSNGLAYLYLDTTGFGGIFTAHGIKYKKSNTAPADTTVGWINTSHNIYETFPVHYYVEGQWTPVDTVGGQFYDNIGKIFTRGYPYVIIATGQSNLGGSYIGETSNPNAPPFNGYYGDTTACLGVSAWNNNRDIWTVAKIRDTPFQYSSGANYLLLASKKIYEHTGRSVRIVTYPQGGTGLHCWAGVPGASPTDSSCYIEFKSRVQNSGVRNPDVFIWAQSEAGITPVPTNTTYFDKWKEMVDSMIARDHLMDTTTLKILMASGDTLTNGDVLQMANGTSAGEGALRALAATNDRTIKYVDAISYQTQISDGLHILPKGHEEIATRLFNSIMEGQKNPARDMMGYGSPAPYKFSSVKQEVAMGGLVAVNNSGKTYFDLGSTGNNTKYTAAEPNLSNQYAPGIEFIQASDIVRFSHYNSTTRFQLEQTRVLFNAPIAVFTSVQAYSGANPYFSLQDNTTNKEWRMYMDNGSNTLRFAFDNSSKWGVTSTGQMGIGTYTPDASAKLQLNSTTQGFLPPRMTATEGSAISSPAEGLIIYVTNTNGTFTAKGWWGWDGASWLKLNN